jgi:hypothetical protein
MTPDKCRESFIAYVRSYEPAEDRPLLQNDGGTFKNSFDEADFSLWQAAWNAALITADRALHAREARERIEFLEKALGKIARPIEFLLSELPPGHLFDGKAACRIADNPHWARDIARAALTAPTEGGE